MVTVNDYKILSEIGHGAFGKVYKAQHKLSGTIVAIKCIKVDRKSKIEKYINSEIDILRNIKHRNIVELYETYRTENSIYLIMEYCAGEITQLMKEQKIFTESEACYFLTQISSALSFMRSHHMVHRDIKPSNILLSEVSLEGEVKLADFGFARYIEDMAETICGTPVYMSPEMLKGEKYNSKTDLWSVGCILFQMIFGHVPFIARNQHLLLENIKKGLVIPEVPEISSECKDLLIGLLNSNPVERISYEEFFRHPFLQKRSQPIDIIKQEETIKSISPVLSSSPGFSALSFAIKVASEKLNIPEDNEEIVLNNFITKLSKDSFTTECNKILEKIENIAKQVVLIISIADSRNSYNAYLLYYKALTLLKKNFQLIRKYLSLEKSRYFPELKSTVNFLKDKFNYALNKAMELKSQHEISRTTFSQEELTKIILEEGIKLAQNAALEELVKNYKISEILYSDAILLLNSIKDINVNEHIVRISNRLKKLNEKI